jgi:hypothetical protein
LPQTKPVCGVERCAYIWFGQKGAFMKTRFLPGPLAAAALLLCTFSAWAGVLVAIPSVPGSTFMFASGINDKNVFTGYYGTSDGAVHGYVGTIDGRYQLFDAPSGGTACRGINNAGYITIFAAPSGDHVVGDSMLRKPDGTIVPITMDGSPIDGSPQSIIQHQKFVGERWVLDQDNNIFIYGYYGKGTRYKADLTLPFDTQRTRPGGYNSRGEVVGYYRPANSNGYDGFVLKKGVATDVQYPDERAWGVLLGAVNDDGQIVGGWQDQDLTVGNAFYYNLKDDSFDVIDVPGSAWSTAIRVNKYGTATIHSDIGAFIYCQHAKNCPTSADAIEVNERHVAGGLARSLACEHGCIGPYHASAATRRDPAAIRAALARDPELQRELRLPFRP